MKKGGGPTPIFGNTDHMILGVRVRLPGLMRKTLSDPQDTHTAMTGDSSHLVKRNELAKESWISGKKCVLLVSKNPRKLTWNPKMEVWKMIFLFNWVIFRFLPLIFRGVNFWIATRKSLEIASPWIKEMIVVDPIWYCLLIFLVIQPPFPPLWVLHDLEFPRCFASEEREATSHFACLNASWWTLQWSTVKNTHSTRVWNPSGMIRFMLWVDLQGTWNSRYFPSV